MSDLLIDFLTESNAIEEVHSDEALQDSLEAWDYLKKQKTLTMKVILETHRLIMQRVNPQIGGFLRRCNVRIGGNVKMDWKKVETALGSLIGYKVTSALSALDWHFRFEDIHPFEDGNGRTGRLIYYRHCWRLGLSPLIFRKKDVAGYYALWQKGKR